MVTYKESRLRSCIPPCCILNTSYSSLQAFLTRQNIMFPVTLVRHRSIGRCAGPRQYQKPHTYLYILVTCRAWFGCMSRILMRIGSLNMEGCNLFVGDQAAPQCSSTLVYGLSTFWHSPLLASGNFGSSMGSLFSPTSLGWHSRLGSCGLCVGTLHIHVVLFLPLVTDARRPSFKPPIPLVIR